MRKTLLFVLAAVLLTAMIFSTATADGPNANPDAPRACTCDDRADDVPAPDGDAICDNCLCPIPGDGIPNGDGDGDPDCPN